MQTRHKSLIAQVLRDEEVVKWWWSQKLVEVYSEVAAASICELRGGVTWCSIELAAAGLWGHGSRGRDFSNFVTFSCRPTRTHCSLNSPNADLPPTSLYFVQLGQPVVVTLETESLGRVKLPHMADVRALLAAERQSRRISHPHLTYSKTGALTCNVCGLNVKSEQLWSGHLKSLNHRKNVQKISEPVARPAKRKIDSVEEDQGRERNYEVDSRKKPKSALESKENSPPVPEREAPSEEPPTGTVNGETQPSQPDPTPNGRSPSTSQIPPAIEIDEDEWAAFERDVAEVAKPEFAAAVIEAAPVSAAELAVQQKTNAVQQREDDAEAEKEDEGRRMEEEFDVMEEMEDRLRRLRTRREALRTTDPPTTLADLVETEVEAPLEDSRAAEPVANGDSSEDDDEDDDWYT